MAVGSVENQVCTKKTRDHASTGAHAHVTTLRNALSASLAPTPTPSLFIIPSMHPL